MLLPAVAPNPTGVISVYGPDGNLYREAEPIVLPIEDREKALVSAWDALYRVAFAQPGYNPDILLQHKGWNEADEMLSMAPYLHAILVKLYACLYKTPQTIPAVLDAKKDKDKYDRAQEAAEFCQYLDSHIYDPDTDMTQDLRSVLWYVLYAVHAGFSCQELIWRLFDRGEYAGKLGLRYVAYKHPKQIGFDLYRDTLAPVNITSYTPVDGYKKIPVDKCILYTFQPRNSLPYGWGNFRPAHKHVKMIEGQYKLWALTNQRYAAGFLKVKSPNPDPNYMKEVRSIIDTVGNAGTLVYPATLELELEQLTGTGFQSIDMNIRHQISQIVKVVLGQELTTQAGQGEGSYALGGIHKNTEKFFTNFPRKDVEFVWRHQVYARALRYNFGDRYEDVVPYLSLGKWDWEELSIIGKFFSDWTNAGIMLPKDPYIKEETGIPPTPPEIEAEEEARRQEELAIQRAQISARGNANADQ